MITIVTTSELSELLMVHVSTIRRWIKDYGFPTSPSDSKRTYYFDIFDVYDWFSQREGPVVKKIKSRLMYRRRLHQYIFVTCFPEGGNLYFRHTKIKKETDPDYKYRSRICNSYDISKEFRCKTYNLRVWINNGMPYIKGTGIANYIFDFEEVLSWIRANRRDVYDEWKRRKDES